MDRSYPDRWASWVARWLVVGMVVTVGAYSWSSTADRGGPPSASPACADGFTAAMTRLQAQPQICVGALGDRTAALSTDATVRDLDLLWGALGEDVMTVVGWSYDAWLARYAYLFSDWARTPIHTALERSLCVAQQVPPYLVEMRVPGGHAC